MSTTASCEMEGDAGAASSDTLVLFSLKVFNGHFMRPFFPTAAMMEKETTDAITKNVLFTFRFNSNIFYDAADNYYA